MAKKPLLCFICGKPCAGSDRNTDGSYAHGECLTPYSLRPVQKSV